MIGKTLLALSLGFSQPQAVPLAPGVISTAADEGPFALAPDGLTLWFTRFEAGMSRPGFFVSHLSAGRWSEPRQAAFPEGASPAPFTLSPDGARLYFTRAQDSMRRSRIWVADRDGDGFKNARPAGGALEKWDADQTSPSVTSDGTLYFASNRRGDNGGWDIYRSVLRDGAYQEPELAGGGRLQGISTLQQENSVAVSPDGRLMIFSSLGAQNGSGGYDLYIAELPQTERGRAWVANLGRQVNTPADEMDPKISADGKRLYFSRSGDIYEADLERLRRPPVESAAWKQTTEMPTPRPWPQAAVANGRICLGAGDAKQVDCFDPATRSWSALPPGPQELGRATLLAFDDRLILFRPSSSQRPGVAEYDPQSKKWLVKSPAPNDGSQAETRSVVLGHKAYTVFRAGGSRPFNALAEYDFDTGVSTPKGSIPLPGWHYVAFEGRIYAFGGGEDSMHISVYDPAADRWQNAGRMHMPLWGCAIAAYRNEIWLIGGHGQRSIEPMGGDLRPSVMRFDPRRGTWAPGPELPSDRVTPAAAIVNGRLFVLGGTRPRAEFAPDASVLEYEPPAGTKSVLRNLPERTYFTTFAIRGKIYAFKYVDDDMTSAAGLAAAGDVYAYDSLAGKWERRAKMPSPKASPAFVSLNDRVYRIGGLTGPNTPSDSVEEYDPATDRWTSKKSMPTARCRMGTVVLGGAIYALGGKTGEGVTTNAVEAYDPVSDSWSAKRGLSKPLMGVSAAAVNGKIYKVKGTQLVNGRFDMVMDFEEYDPSADTWTKRAPWTYEREPLETVAVDGRLFVVGGGAFTGSDVHSLKEYDIASDRWLFRSDMPPASAHTIHPTWTVHNGKIYTFGGGYRDAGGGWKASDRAQRYDPRTNTWEELPPLAEGKIGMGVAAAGDRIYVIGGEKMGASGQSAKNEFSDAVEIYEIR